jgi:type I restriction enzyme S subunit
VPDELDNQIASTGFEVVKPLLVDSRFVFALTKSKDFIDSISGVVQGALYPAAKSSDVQAYTFQLPALAEQKVIADKLDKLLAQVEATKARLERLPEILKNFRQSVLAAAVSGKLTEEWREVNKSDFTKEERLEEIRKYKYETWIDEQEAKYEAKGKWPKTESWKKKYKEAEIDPEFKSRELPESWVYQPLDGLVYISARIGWKGLKASEYTQSGPLFLSVHSLNYGREVKLSEAFHISKERYDESPEIMLQNDDILLCKDGAGIGKIGIVKNLEEPASINSSLLLIRSGKYFVPEFLYFFLAGPKMQRLVQERMTGSAVPHLFQRDVKEFVLEIPPISEQREIVRRVEELLAFADRIEAKASSARGKVNKLTQSILAKAFRGELTAEWRAANPELISGENSAEALLERIKAEREALKSKPKPKRTEIKKKTGSRMSKNIINVADALKQTGKPLTGQQLLAEAGYPSDSSTEQLEQFFLDIRDALTVEKSIVKLDRDDDGQDWFALAEPVETKKT